MSLQDGLEEGGGAAGFVGGDLFGGALGDEVAAFGAGFGADVDEVVGFGEDVGVVLDDDDGVAFVHEAVEEFLAVAIPQISYFQKMLDLAWA